ncbi:MAG TPA: bifunctional 5,10-methylenetetrahydrofolate dehydrogenase/5,10-methenyltetrahydrofolate cyclohydrolase [Firmicutes bacterium]|nr:bifunctional 5,10-methylenetetrahydrofolate dehydrogenase/5,10-methenyltetrahydrofolate cyclohydrolase [Bacillota bacterium]
MAERLRGKPVADAMKEDLLKRVEQLKAKGLTPKIGIIRVGANPDDLFYEGGIKKTSDGVGMAYEIFEHPEDIGQEELEKAVRAVGADSAIHGILMFAPLPKHLDEKKIRSLIPVEKDVDCMTLGSAGKVFADDVTGFPPCTPTACMEMLRFYDVPLKGKRVTVVGRSMVVGKPMAMLLLREHATVTICHSRTVDLAKVCAEADILVAAVGRPRMIGRDYVRAGQIVFDVGINADPDNPGKYCGDVDYDAVEPVVEKITPVPGGVGSVTTIMLCKHTVMACEMQQE